MDKNSQKVIDQFFQVFYDERIRIAKLVGKDYNKQLDIALLLFWFSVIDFYGGIYYVGVNDKTEKYKGGRLKLAHKESFKKFINDFFPKPENELGEFIYSIFRSGLVHQLSPKKAGIIWDSSNPRLLWIDIDNHNIVTTTNKITIINLYKFEQLAYKAYEDFKTKVENDQLITECERIYKHLLLPSDILEDGATLDDQYSKLSPSTQKCFTL